MFNTHQLTTMTPSVYNAYTVWLFEQQQQICPWHQNWTIHRIGIWHRTMWTMRDDQMWEKLNITDSRKYLIICAVNNVMFITCQWCTQDKQSNFMNDEQRKIDSIINGTKSNILDIVTIEDSF